MTTPDIGAWTDYDRLIDERFERWTDELRDFCSIPSETAHLPELQQGATWVADRLRAAAAEVTVLTQAGIPPLVIGELGSGPRTLVAVQHYDVQPAAPLDLWETGPFDPHVREGRLYARGACDDKGEFLLRVQAIEALREAGGDLPCRVRFIVEGEEGAAAQPSRSSSPRDPKSSRATGRSSRVAEWTRPAARCWCVACAGCSTFS